MGNRLARGVGLYTPVRALYNSLFLSRSTRTVSIGPLHATFSTPTHTIMEHVESLGGERLLLEQLVEELREDDVFWDVGASFGLYAVIAAWKISTPGAVVAFEPEPRMRALLERNLRLNGIESVSVRATALGDRDGITQLFRAANPNTGSSSLALRRDYKLRKKGTPVEVRRGDTLAGAGGSPPPTCLKIDVEGSEGRVVAGMENLLRNGRLRSLFCEVHPQLLPSFGDSAASFERTLVDSGFAITERTPRGSEYHLVCRR
ncbi:MAG TPA: FkbM family methyltransferase [Bacteroidota bacterium]